ncbi:MAG: hypothetical protein PHV68_10135, partial [Candidatus Gastranaerophilales bacterium]|nr:hypothetical protein [Candidatus Gastranaerophilales bacterium]
MLNRNVRGFKMNATLNQTELTCSCIDEIFRTLKKLYNVENSEQENVIKELVRQNGYLPYSHIKALTELTPAQTIAGLEEKFKLSNTFDGEKFEYDFISPLKREQIENSNWIKKEQHSIKLVNLAGLGNGNENDNVGQFIDWLKQLLILPAGNIEQGIFPTTMYLIPFHPREFGCAYLPTSSDVSSALEDKAIKDYFDFNAKEQVKLFIALTQLAGHPVMYDVLPQTGRFSKTVLARPFIARWFDIKTLILQLQEELDNIEIEGFSKEDLTETKSIISNELNGKYTEITDNIKDLYEKIQEKFDEKKKEFSNQMLLKRNQETLCYRAKYIVNTAEHKDVISENEIQNQGQIIGNLINEGLWPSPGGAWCSCGIPVFDKMSENAGYPMFKHCDFEGNDVTHFANLDCQTPYYFVYLENGQYNENVINFYVEFLKKIQSEYNFDGFRVDHIDHIVDAFSEDENKNPISYRAPREVLKKVNIELKKQVPYFATLAEYMLWDNFYTEYHKEMAFDVLWGNDIVSQFEKTVKKIIEDNEFLANYNKDNFENPLSILKTYNNQDGEFEAINQYPGQMKEDGAIFKWMKYRFLPAGNFAQ